MTEWMKIAAAMTALLVGINYLGAWTRSSCLGGSAFACGSAAFLNVVSADEIKAALNLKENDR